MLIDFVFVWLPNIVMGGFIIAIICAVLFSGLCLTEYYLFGRRNYVKDNSGKYLGNSKWDYVLFIAGIIAIISVIIWQWVKS